MTSRFRIAIWISLGVLIFPLIGGCDYARMRNQEDVRTYEKEMPAMDSRAIPGHGGYNVLINADPADLKNPLPLNPETVHRGWLTYAYFCMQCHGPYSDGNGTVGQSFAPLPANLKDPAVQEQTDGELYAKILLGFARHPALYTTVSEQDAWAAVNYIRSLKTQDGRARERKG